MSSSFIRRKMMMIGARRSALDEAHGRVVIIKIVFALAFILISARLVDLSFIQGEVQKHLAGDGAAEVHSMAEASTIRANITDRNGVLLATSLETASLYADPHIIISPEKTVKDLVRIMPDLSYGDTLQKLQRKSRFVWIKRNLTPKEQYEILNLGEPGLAFRNELRRIYPQGSLTAHIVGYTDVDGKGLGGIERSFNKYLQEGGDSLATSIDVRLQHVLRRETMREIKDFSAKGGVGIIMDLSNGEVLAATSLPDFDPHDPGASSQKALFNNFSLGVFELGSTFKLFSTAALLELKNAPMSMVFNTVEPLKRGRFTIRDYHPEKRPLTVPEVFMHSSNIGSALMGEKVGTEGLRGFYEDLGLLKKAKLEIEEIGTPLYPQPWREINTLTAAFGHGVAVSPMQMVAAAATIVGGGTLVRSTLVLDGSDKEKGEHDVRVVSAQTAHRMRQLLRLVVTEGTGGKAEVPGFRVGGKTGTAEKPGNRGYDRKRLISSFLGFFPMEAPRYAVFIMVDEPQGTKASFGYATGGWVAAPAVGRVIANMAAILGISPKDIPEEQDMAAGLRQYVHDPKKQAALNAIQPAAGGEATHAPQ